MGEEHSPRYESHRVEGARGKVLGASLHRVQPLRAVGEARACKVAQPTSEVDRRSEPPPPILAIELIGDLISRESPVVGGGGK